MSLLLNPEQELVIMHSMARLWRVVVTTSVCSEARS